MSQSKLTNLYLQEEIKLHKSFFFGYSDWEKKANSTEYPMSYICTLR